MGYTDETLYNRDVRPGPVDGSWPRLVATANKMAYDLINSRLSNRYTVPFEAPYPSEAVTISNMLVGAFLVTLQAKASNPLDVKGAKDPFKLATDWLDRIAQSKSNLTGVEPLSSTATWTVDF